MTKMAAYYVHMTLSIVHQKMRSRTPFTPFNLLEVVVQQLIWRMHNMPVWTWWFWVDRQRAYILNKIFESLLSRNNSSFLYLIDACCWVLG